MRSMPFEVTFDKAFYKVIAKCAEAAPDHIYTAIFIHSTTPTQSKSGMTMSLLADYMASLLVVRFLERVCSRARRMRVKLH